METYIDTQVQKFIKEHANLINLDDWEKFWVLAEQRVYDDDGFAYIIPKMRSIFDEANINSLKNLDYIPDGYYYEDTSITTSIVPEGFQTIKSFAYFGCENLKSIKLPSTLLTIEDNAFQYCNAIEHIEIPIKIEFIHDYTFKKCTNLKRIIYSGTKKQFSEIEFGDEVFQGCKFLDHISCLDGIIKIDENGDPILE